MSVVYITSQGSKISKEGRHLVLKVKDQEPCSILTFKLNQMVLIGNVEITTSAIKHLLYSGVELVFLSYDGRFVGRVVGELPKNVFLRKQQYRKAEDEEFVREMARTLVLGKLRNQLTLLKRIYRYYKPPKVEQPIQDLTLIVQRLRNASTLNQIRGYEGKGSALFFRGFPEGFRNRNDFRKRVRRPPTDPINAVLSFCYTLLMNRVYGAVYAAGLDPYLGSLHVLEYGRPSLVLDLMEEFRTIVVDTLTLSLFNMNILTDNDFYVYRPSVSDKVYREPEPDVQKDPLGQMSDVPAEFTEGCEADIEEGLGDDDGDDRVYPVRLKEDGLKKLLHQFERKMKTKFFYEPLGRNIDYHKALYEQAKLYAKVIKGEVESYKPLRMQ